MRQPAERSLGHRAVALIALASFVTACATPAAKPPPPVTRAPLPRPAPVPATPPPPPPAPTPSIGPREVTLPPAPRVETPPPPMVPQPSTAPPVPPGQRGRFVVLNFDNADIETVVHAASEIVGFNYVLAPDVRGKVTVQTSGRIPQEDVFGVMLAILEVHGFTAVKSGNLYKIVRIEGARERAVPTIVGLEPDPNRTADEVITQIVPVRFSSVADLATLLRPLVSQRGNLVAHRETNVLMVTDSANNVRRLLDIVRMVDVEIALDELQIIQIRYADAADLATILNQLFASGRLRRTGGTGTVTPGAPAAPPPTAPGTLAPPTAPGARPPAVSGTETTGAERAPLIVAERRSNSLIVYARKHELETVRRLITQLDVNIYGGRRVFIYYAENAKSKELAATLNSIYGGRDSVPTTTGTGTGPGRAGQPALPPPPPGTSSGQFLTPAAVGTIGDLGAIEGQVRFIGDEVTNSIIVTTFPRNWPEIETTIKQLDRQPRQVLVEVLVAEITLTDDLRLGVDWAVKSGRFNFASQSISTASPSAIAPLSRILPIAEGSALAVNPGLTAFTFATNQFMLLLNALASLNLINVLSNPHVLTSENKKAVINVSASVPIVTSQQVPIGGTTQATTGTTSTQAIVGTQSVEYRDAGVILTVTPRIGEQGTVALDIKQEVNAIGPAQPPTGSPQIIKREAETSVVLMNNQTLVLGGLIRDAVTTADRGVPFFKDIPILGYLFGAKVRTVEKTELLILVTPRVIGTALDAARITDEIRRATPELEDTFRRSPRQPSNAPVPPPSSEIPPAIPPTGPARASRP